MNIAVAGAYGVGRTYRVERFPGAGETVTASHAHDAHGGKGSNQAIAAARLGAHVSLLTAVGSDDSATGARELWLSEGVEASGVVTLEGATMTGVIEVEPSGENRIIIAPGVLDALTPRHADDFRGYIAAADALVVSLEIPVPVALRAMKIAQEENVRVVLNPAPAVALSPADLAGVDVLTPNATEARALTGIRDLAGAARRLARWTGGAVVVTLGGDGVLVVDDGEPVRLRPHPVASVIDTTGAGDSFTAALTVALTASLPIARAARWAAAAGAITVQTDGVIPGLPYLDQLPPLTGLAQAKDSL